MSETAVIDEPRIDSPAAPPIAVDEGERPVPVKKPRHFLVSLRFNGLRYVMLSATLLLAWGLVEAAERLGARSPEATFALVLAGGLLAAAAKTSIDILSWAEANRQAVHVERVHAVQRVFQRACTVRDQAVTDWRRIHTFLVDNLTGQEQKIRLFSDHDETDRQGEKLMQKALSEETWIRADGVDAVRRFKKEIAALDYDALATEADFLGAFNRRMDGLRRDLALAALGVPLE